MNSSGSFCDGGQEEIDLHVSFEAIHSHLVAPVEAVEEPEVSEKEVASDGHVVELRRVLSFGSQTISAYLRRSEETPVHVVVPDSHVSRFRELQDSILPPMRVSNLLSSTSDDETQEDRTRHSQQILQRINKVNSHPSHISKSNRLPKSTPQRKYLNNNNQSQNPWIISIRIIFRPIFISSNKIKHIRHIFKRF